MNEKNTAYLVGRYPVLYQGHTWPITQNLMAFGFECGATGLADEEAGRRQYSQTRGRRAEWPRIR